MAARVARDLVIHGRVQGVFFRAFVANAAARAGVGGWAINRGNGTLAVRLEGEPDAVAKVERACRQGPERARVDRIDGTDVAVEELDRFDVR